MAEAEVSAREYETALCRHWVIEYAQLLVLAGTSVEAKLCAKFSLPRGRRLAPREAVLLHDELAARTAQQLSLLHQPADVNAVRVLGSKFGGLEQLDGHVLTVALRPRLENRAHASASRLLPVAGRKLRPLDLASYVAECICLRMDARRPAGEGPTSRRVSALISRLMRVPWWAAARRRASRGCVDRARSALRRRRLCWNPRCRCLSRTCRVRSAHRRCRRCRHLLLPNEI